VEAACAADERTEQKLVPPDQGDAQNRSGVRSSKLEVRSFQTLPRAPECPERSLKIGLDGRKRRVDELASRNGDDVEGSIAGRPAVSSQPAAKHFAQAPLRPVSHDRAAHLARRDDPQPIPVERIGPAQQRHVPRGDTSSALLHRRELTARAKADVSTIR
jgi:hypothetical protein